MDNRQGKTSQDFKKKWTKANLAQSTIQVKNILSIWNIRERNLKKQNKKETKKK